jgi:hypothetical protein
MLKTKHPFIALLCVLSIVFTFSSCKKDRTDDEQQETLIPGPDVNFYALTSDSKLLLINAKSPSTVTSQVSISGLQSGESILGIDFRPATGQLYGVSSGSRLYIIDPKTGASRAVSTTAFAPAVSGTAVGFDFNPAVDRIRLVTSNGQNLRLHPETGALAGEDTPLTGVSNARVTAAAYTQNRAGTSTTGLFDIDVTNDKLHRQDPPNEGKLVEIGSLGYNVEEASGFDINPEGNAALAALSVSGTSGLYSIDLASGKASKIGNFSQQIIGLAIPTEPVAYAISANNEFLIFNPMSANPTVVTKTITGIQTGETILGIDMRPLNGQIYAIGSTSRIYTLNASSGAAAAVSATPLSPLLSGTNFGFDFNPVGDRIRIVSNTGQNLRINPVDGVGVMDTNLSLTTVGVSASAYTNNFTGAATTVLYNIDPLGDRLYKQDPPNAGTLVDVGPLGINIESANGFDIGSTSGIAYGLFTVGTTQKIYTVNLTNGTATALGTVTTSARAFTLGLGF